MGLAGSHAPMAALVALACAAGGAGVVWQGAGQEIVERAPEGAMSEESAAADAQRSEGGAESAQSQEAQAQVVRCLVHVDGAVMEPGVVELTGADLRVYDAVKKAGGLLDDADTSAINLAEPLADGAKIHIPHEGEVPAATSLPAAGQTETSGATGVAGGSSLININTATAEELQTLSGVGEATAAAIIRDREQNGPFASPEDLMRVSGIGEKKFAKVKDDICV